VSSWGCLGGILGSQDDLKIGPIEGPAHRLPRPVRKTPSRPPKVPKRHPNIATRGPQDLPDCCQNAQETPPTHPKSSLERPNKPPRTNQETTTSRTKTTKKKNNSKNKRARARARKPEQEQESKSNTARAREQESKSKSASARARSNKQQQTNNTQQTTRHQTAAIQLIKAKGEILPRSPPYSMPAASDFTTKGPTYPP